MDTSDIGTSSRGRGRRGAATPAQPESRLGMWCLGRAIRSSARSPLTATCVSRARCEGDVTATGEVSVHRQGLRVRRSQRTTSSSMAPSTAAPLRQRLHQHRRYRHDHRRDSVSAAARRRRRERQRNDFDGRLRCASGTTRARTRSATRPPSMSPAPPPAASTTVMRLPTRKSAAGWRFRCVDSDEGFLGLRGLIAEAARWRV